MLVIGGGAAGMIAAIRAAELGANVTIIEKNEKLGKKLYITGKGRCNLTNTSSREEFFANIRDNPKFLMSAFSAFNNIDIMELLERLNVPMTVERGGRVFPQSGKSNDIISAFKRQIEKLDIKVLYNTKVIDIQKNNAGYTVYTNTGKHSDKAVIIATGGVSYSATGSTGDGYAFAKKLGHSIVETKASLIGLLADNTSKMSGLTLKNVAVKAVADGKIIANDFGELLYTHIGLSGPTILTLSSYVNRLIDKSDIEVVIDLKPALTNEELDNRILRDFADNSNKILINAMDKLLPKALIEEVISKSGLSKNIVVNQITREQRNSLVNTLKGLKYKIKGLDDINNAIITSGGVRSDEVNPKTMESKLNKGLFFAGEVLDVAALTGGYNLQIAWSTGYVAGENAAYL